jgi:hypothetical protein
MRTTIDLPEPVFHALEAQAAREGSSLQTVILKAIESQIVPADDLSKHRRLQLPLLRSSRPGSLRSLTNAEIDEILR